MTCKAESINTYKAFDQPLGKMKRTKLAKPQLCAPLTEAYVAVKRTNCRPENTTRETEEGGSGRA